MSSSDASIPNNISEIVLLLQSGFTPQKKEDFEVLQDICKIPNHIIQQLILEAVERSDLDSGLPIIIEIAMGGTNAETRRLALNSLSHYKDPAALEAFLICAHDENIENQLMVLRELKGQSDSQVLDLLIDKMQHPAVALLPDNSTRQDDIRTAAVESLAIGGANRAIKPLLETIQSHNDLRIKARQSITAIGTNDAVEALLRICEGSDEEFPDPDKSLKMELTIAISEMGHKRFARGQLERYRQILADILSETQEIPTYRRQLIAEITLRIDEHLCESLIEEFEKHSDDPTGTEIIEEITKANLAKSRLFWKKAFELWPPSNQHHIKNGFQEAAQSNTEEALTFLEESICIESTLNQADRLPQIYGDLSADLGHPLIMMFCRNLDLPIVRKNSTSYLNQIWSQTPSEKKNEFLTSLTLQKYQEAETIDFVAGYLSPRWNENIDNKEGLISVIDVLFLLWEKKKATRTQIGEIIQLIISKQSSNHDLCAGICDRASNTRFGSAEWDLIEVCMNKADPSLMCEILRSKLEGQWHQGLVETLIHLNSSHAIRIINLHLAGSEANEKLKGDQRVWAIEKIGEIGSVGDFDFLLEEIDGKSIKTAEAATIAVSRIDPDAGQAILRDSLESRKTGVVHHSLEGLQKIDDISPETISAIRHRVDSERDSKLKIKASETMGVLLNKLIEQRPDIAQEIETIQNWLLTLAAFPASEISGKALEEMLLELGEREASEIRLALANAVQECCLADVGIALAERELTTERRPEVVSAWENSLDALKGLPDRGVLNLIQRICKVDIDRDEIFGGKSLEEIFIKPEITLPALNLGLRGVERVLGDPDATAERLNSTAEVLIDELLWFAGEEPEKFDTYANKIGRSKKICVPAMRHADHLLNIREQIVGPHAKDSAGQLRKGIGVTEVEEAKRAFVSLFQEVVIHLRGQ